MASRVTPGMTMRIVRSSGRLAVALTIATACLVAAPSRASAQVDQGWHVSFSPYIWGAATKGTVGAGGQTASVDLSFSEMLKHVNLGFMSVLEARNGPWILFLDDFYAALSDDETTGGVIITDVSIKLHLLMLQPEIGYTVLQRPWGGIDALGGIRYWHEDADLTFVPRTGSPRSGSGSKSWVDGIIGTRLRFDPSPRWHLSATADIGAGGSDFTWEAAATAGYAVSQCCSLGLGYRHLAVDYEKDDFVNDIYMTGPILGFSWRF